MINSNSRTISSLKHGVFLAMAYLLAGKLGLLLQHNTLASGLFPAAGVAVAAAYLWGQSSYQWLFLGCLLFQLWGFQFELRMAPITAAIGLALGTTLQAGFGGWLLRRAIGPDTELDSGAQVMRFMLLAPLFCLVSASLAVSTLAALGLVQGDQIATFWATWWIGDLQGVLVVFPLMLSYFGQFSIWQQRRLTFVPIMLLALGLAAYSYETSNTRQIDKFAQVFKSEAAAMAVNLEHHLNEQCYLLDQLETYFSKASQQVEREEFSAFVQPALRRFPLLQAIEWAPQVMQAERGAFEMAQQKALPSFQIREQNSTGSLVAAAARPSYFPVTYIQPLANNEMALGFDLNSTPERKAAALAAMRSDEPVASEPIRLVQESASQVGVLLLRRVDTAHPGLVLIVLRMGDFVSKILPKDSGKDMEVTLVDKLKGEVIYGQPLIASALVKYEQEIYLGGRVYQFQATSTPAYENAYLKPHHWEVMTLGTLGFGVLNGLLLLITGMTSRVQKQVIQRTQELANRDEYLIAIHNASLDGIVTIDESDNIIQFNASARDIFGFSADEILGKPLGQSLIPQRYCAAHAQGMAHFKATGFGPVLNQRLELTALRKSGEEFPIELAITPITVSDKQCFTGFIRDISLRKKLDEELRASESMKKAILDACLDGVMTLNHQEEIIEFNPSASIIFGYSTDEIVGKKINDLFVISQSVTTLKACMRVISDDVGSIQKTGQHHEICAIRKSGEEFPLEIAMIPIFQEGKQFFVLFVRDISDRKRVADALRHGQEQAEQANLMKSQFLATMSHEIRTPLTSILGAQELLAGTPLNSDQRNYLDLANDASNTLLALINDILDFSKIEAGKLQFENCTFNPIQVVEEVVTLLSLKAQQKKLALACAIEDDVAVAISGDPLRFRQVLLNLLSNAVKFTESGGVTIKVSRQANSQSKNVLFLEVIDTGIGIAENVQPLLFDSFVQADVSDTRKYGGSGLGLAICKRLVELWGGAMGVDSQLGCGSRFWFTFGEPADLSQLPVNVEPSAPNPTESFNTHARLLLVEDSMVNQIVISAMLHSMGFAQLDVVGSGVEAIAAVQQQSYDLVFMDISMPDMTGMDATRAIRQLEGRARLTPIVAMTAHAIASYRDQCLEAGMNDYATKPVAKSRLLALIEQWCGRPMTNPQTEIIQQQNVDDQSTLSDFALDEATLNSLGKNVDMDDITPLLHIFISELENRHPAIIRAIDEQDIGKLRLEAHSLKSASATFGAKALHAVALVTDTCCQTGDWDGARLNAEKLLVCAEATLGVLHQRCQK